MPIVASQLLQRLHHKPLRRTATPPQDNRDLQKDCQCQKCLGGPGLWFPWRLQDGCHLLFWCGEVQLGGSRWRWPQKARSLLLFSGPPRTRARRIAPTPKSTLLQGFRIGGHYQYNRGDANMLSRGMGAKCKYFESLGSLVDY